MEQMKNLVALPVAVLLTGMAVAEPLKPAEAPRYSVTSGTILTAAATPSDGAVMTVQLPPHGNGAAVLIYPVITMGEQTHGGSKSNLLGPSPDASAPLMRIENR